jgi:hypothetical protein
LITLIVDARPGLGDRTYSTGDKKDQFLEICSIAAV